jgi:Mn2+/Fe2+ NRAMP family transporter
MGAQVNTWLTNVAAWAAVGVISVLNVFLLVTQI